MHTFLSINFVRDLALVSRTALKPTQRVKHEVNVHRSLNSPTISTVLSFSHYCYHGSQRSSTDRKVYTVLMGLHVQ